MATLGTVTKPNGGWYGSGAGVDNQAAEILTMPQRGRILTLGAWIGGWNDTPRTRLCLWEYPSKLLIGQSAQFFVANRGDVGGNKQDLYTAALEVPVDLGKGVSFYTGFARHPDDKHQVSTGSSGSGPHYYARSGAIWPNNFGNAEGPVEVNRRIGCHVANWETLPGAWIYRSGAWVEAETVQAYRSGAWVDVDGVQIYRAGTWVDAE
jgi:hypothetical protein